MMGRHQVFHAPSSASPFPNAAIVFGFLLDQIAMINVITDINTVANCAWSTVYPKYANIPVMQIAMNVAIVLMLFVVRSMIKTLHFFYK